MDEAADSEVYACGFDQAVGGLPPGWRVDTTNPRAGQSAAVWARRADASAPSPRNVLQLEDAARHSGGTYNLCWTDDVQRDDVDLSVGVHAEGGVEDQGGGPAWRIAGADDYYLARWNPLEDNFRVYSVVDGRRVELDSADVEADPRAWHTIRVTHIGSRITCWFDGEQLLDVSNDAIRAAGGAGVWTKADATTRFDDFRVKAAPR
ncbi:MAG: hypothetical protein H6831_16000 [Planctomycetes bacterium]|nr:hypothetical protein [Planctomycetota bacterium]MCB9905903.1 hypothetical protein [Planctomycetota bacterium]